MDGIKGEPVEFESVMFQRHTTLQILETSQQCWENRIVHQKISLEELSSCRYSIIMWRNVKNAYVLKCNDGK